MNEIQNVAISIMYPKSQSKSKSFSIIYFTQKIIENTGIHITKINVSQVSINVRNFFILCKLIDDFGKYLERTTEIMPIFWSKLRNYHVPNIFRSTSWRIASVISPEYMGFMRIVRGFPLKISSLYVPNIS